MSEKKSEVIKLDAGRYLLRLYTKDKIVVTWLMTSRSEAEHYAREWRKV